ncbi:MAG: GHKL domain-containing protein [Bacteroidota bacterium]|nr:MAG: GHKL domain-containing protein [Bacteroidota bacterium]
MNQNTLRNFYIAILLLALSVTLVKLPGKIETRTWHVKKAQKAFIEKLEKATELIQLVDKEFHSQYVTNRDDYYFKHGVSAFLFRGDTLIAWSDNNVAVEKIVTDTLNENGVVSIFSSSYYYFKRPVGLEEGLGLVLLENNFPHKNRFVVNGMHPGFKLPKGVIIAQKQIKNSLPLKDQDGKIVFFLDFTHASKDINRNLLVLATLLFFTGIYFLLQYLRIYLKYMNAKKRSWALLLVAGALVLARIGLLFTAWPADFYLLFDPYIYASAWAPSLGDLMLHTILFLFIIYLVYRYVRVPAVLVSGSSGQAVWILFFNLIFLLVLAYAIFSSTSLIANSSLKILVQNISQLKLPVIIAYIIFSLNFFAVLLIALWIFKNLAEIKLYRLVINCGILLSVAYFMSFAVKLPFELYSVLFAFILYSLLAYMQRHLQRNTIFSTLMVFLLLFSVYILFFTVKTGGQKEYQQNRSLAIGLSAEHDPVAEYFFRELSRDLESDTAIVRNLEPDAFDIVSFYDYLRKKHLDGYWKNYDFTVTVCRPIDSVLVSSGSLFLYPCYTFFEEIIQSSGIVIPNTQFFYIDKNSGLINYLGWISYKIANNSSVSVFIEMESRFTSNQLGYPELLLDEDLNSGIKYEGRSYAKYNKGNLLSFGGNYDYSLSSEIFEKGWSGEFRQIKHNGYLHLVFRSNPDNIVVISVQELNALDYMVLFSYVFVFFYLLALFFTFLLDPNYRKFNFSNSLRNKIQFSVVFILIVSLVLTAGSTIYFNIHKFNQSQQRLLEEKIKMVYVELEHKLMYEEELTANWRADKYDNLSQLLIKFSDVFYSDINLYSPEGKLIATSRDEIFRLGLQSDKMTPIAYQNLRKDRLTRFISKEKISQLSYLSAYAPFLNSEGKLLAYLNLPYFTKQTELQEDITTLTVAIINIYVLLILLTIIIAVIISDQITRPLEMLQAKLRNLKLGSRYEPIEYANSDEIGRLVNEYNSMVLELEKNIELLARSERESAWREMAKQVAHEIKNPLTPMRLSVQQLKRTWNDKREDFETYLQRVTETLLEQIDNLSAIAGEFSNFANMPLAKIEKVEVSVALSKVVSLFDSQDHVKVNYLASPGQYWVMADADQLTRVFINVIKNGIQAIPEGVEGKIEVKLERESNLALIHISDNGKGIPEEIIDRLFTPSFTTKSGGMGLGLAIVKNIVESIDGQVGFTTQVNKGTTFTIRIPLLYE